MARMKHRKTDLVKARHSPHAFEGSEGKPCEACGLNKGNSVHGDMNEIAQRIADREERQGPHKPDTRGTSDTQP